MHGVLPRCRVPFLFKRRLDSPVSAGLFGILCSPVYIMDNDFRHLTYDGRKSVDQWYPHMSDYLADRCSTIWMSTASGSFYVSVVRRVSDRGTLCADAAIPPRGTELIASILRVRGGCILSSGNTGPSSRVSSWQKCEPTLAPGSALGELYFDTRGRWFEVDDTSPGARIDLISFYLDNFSCSQSFMLNELVASLCLEAAPMLMRVPSLQREPSGQVNADALPMLCCVMSALFGRRGFTSRIFAGDSVEHARRSVSAGTGLSDLLAAFND